MAETKVRLSGLLDEADRLYAGRLEVSRVQECLQLLQPFERQVYDAAWRTSRAYFFLGQETGTKPASADSYRRGAEIAEYAQSLEPKRVEAQFWNGVNLALLASVERSVFALPHAIAARRSLSRAVEIDRAYHGAGPLRVLARLEHKLPRMFGGGMIRSRAHFVEALDLDPTNSVTRIYFAELLVDLQDLSAARDQWESVIAAADDPEWEFENRRDKKIARERLGRG